VLVLCAAIVVGCSSDSTKGTAAEDKPPANDELAAQIGDWTLTRAELEGIIARLPDHEQQKYNTPGGKALLTDKLIEEEFYHQEGLKLNLRESEDVQRAVDAFIRSAIVAKYENDEILPLARPAEEELYEYYEGHPQEFTRQAIVRAQHIFSKKREKLVDFKQRIEEGEPMTTLAHKYSEDEMTRQDGGDLGYFNPEGYIRGVGYSKEISEAAFALELGVISDPVKWEKGWSLLRVNEQRPSVIKPFEDVKEQIAERLVARRIDQVKALAFKELKNKYEYQNFLENEFNLTQRTAEELWNLAQNSSDSYHRLRNYTQIVERFPDSEYASQALFMVGFVHAEELKDYVEAERAFARVLNLYPDSDVAESAQYMLDTMNRPVPNFEGIEGNKR
jgi:peptidyl-prolyl cis-trans isomerase C